MSEAATIKRKNQVRASAEEACGAIDYGPLEQRIGYALHELGHKWFTQDRPWDDARREHGGFVSNLINGMEDPRIEQKVINSGFAPNSQALFEFLTNQVLRKSGYVEPDDFKNIPFMLAIEGRRLKGYSICVPSVVDASPYAVQLRWALKAAHKAKDTKRIVAIAIELAAGVVEAVGEFVANHRADLGGGNFLEAGVFHRRNKDDYAFNRFAPLGPVHPFQHTTWVTGGAAEARWRQAEWTVAARAEAQTDRISSTSLTFGRYRARVLTKASATADTPIS